MAQVSNYLAEQVLEAPRWRLSAASCEVVKEFDEAPAVNQAGSHLARGATCGFQVEWHLAYHNETLRNLVSSWGTRLEAWSSLAGPTGQGKLGRSGDSTGAPRVEIERPRI